VEGNRALQQLLGRLYGNEVIVVAFSAVVRHCAPASTQTASTINTTTTMTAVVAARQQETTPDIHGAHVFALGCDALEQAHCGAEIGAGKEGKRGLGVGGGGSGFLIVVGIIVIDGGCW
jgi:hypothetical protein